MLGCRMSRSRRSDAQLGKPRSFFPHPRSPQPSLGLLHSDLGTCGWNSKEVLLKASPAQWPWEGAGNCLKGATLLLPPRPGGTCVSWVRHAKILMDTESGQHPGPAEPQAPLALPRSHRAGQHTCRLQPFLPSGWREAQPAPPTLGASAFLSVCLLMPVSS